MYITYGYNCLLVLIFSAHFSHAYVPIKIILPGMILRMNMTVTNTTRDAFKFLDSDETSGESQEETDEDVLQTRFGKYEHKDSNETVLHVPVDPPSASKIKSNWKYVGVYSMDKDYYLDYNRSSFWGHDERTRKNTSCSGHRQSPIDINPSHASRATQKLWKHFDSTPKELMLINNGYTVQLIGNWGSTPLLVGPGILPYRGKYAFSDITFHWSVYRNGSEHQIAGESFPLEMQLVFYKQLRNRNVMDAVKKDDHIAILSILYRLSDTNNDKLDDLLDGLSKVQVAKTMSKVVPFPLTNLMPDSNGYFEYSGSLTVPPCTETVTWLVMDSHPKISKTQLKAFKQILNLNGIPIVHNSRVLQRRVYAGGLI